MEIKDKEHPVRYCMSNKEVCFGILLGITSVVGLWLFADVLLALFT